MKVNLTKNLEPARAAKLAQIDADANRALESNRTSGNVAALVYKLKRDAVSAADAGLAIDKLALLQAEAQATGVKPQTLLETWRKKIEEEDRFLIEIEARRQALKTKVKIARSPAEIDGVSWF